MQHLLDSEMAARLAQTITDGGTVHVEIVKGLIARHCARCDDDYRAMRTKEHDGPCDRVPPARFAALDKACETCEGTGHYVDDRGEVYEDTCPLDDCKDGRQVIELRTACECWTGRVRNGPCLCRGTNSVPLCRAVVRVVPVQAHEDDNPEGPVLFIEVDENRIVVFEANPLPRPGIDFGIVFEVVP